MGTLDAVGISKTFGGLKAVDGVSITVPPGQITSLIGPNGAGKTTFFNCLTGLLDADGGRVTLDGTDLTGMPAHSRARAGLGRTFQRLEVFVGMTVADNLRVAAEAARPRGTFRGVFRVRPRPEPEITEAVEAVLDRLDLTWARNHISGNLPTGVLRLVELGRALCTNPSVLLLDELASGLDQNETEHLQDVLRDLAVEGLAVLLIEHDMTLVMSCSDTVNVMDFGRLIASGTPAEVAADPTVRTAYLGADAVG